jgi:hypothetical protein
MRAPAVILVLSASVLVAGAAGAMQADTPVDKLSIVDQQWRLDGKFLIFDLTFQNDNPFPLKGVIVSCEIREDKAKPNDNRGLTIRQVLPPGKTKVPGLEFSITGKAAAGGPCRVTTAERNS